MTFTSSQLDTLWHVALIIWAPDTHAQTSLTAVFLLVTSFMTRLSPAFLCSKWWKTGCRPRMRPSYAHDTLKIKLNLKCSRMWLTDWVGISLPISLVPRLCGRTETAWYRLLVHAWLPYFFDQTPWLLFISQLVFVQLLFEGGVYFFESLQTSATAG